jgi:hypothetical protein
MFHVNRMILYVSEINRSMWLVLALAHRPE